MYDYQIIQSTLHYLFLLRFYVNFCAIVVKCKEKKLKEQEIQERIVLNTYICLFPKDTLYVSSSKYILPNAFIFSLTGCPGKFYLGIGKNYCNQLELHITYLYLFLTLHHLIMLFSKTVLNTPNPTSPTLRLSFIFTSYNFTYNLPTSTTPH